MFFGLLLPRGKLTGFAMSVCREIWTRSRCPRADNAAGILRNYLYVRSARPFRRGASHARQALANGEFHEARQIVDLELRHEAAAISIDALGRDAEKRRDLVAGVAF